MNTDNLTRHLEGIAAQKDQWSVRKATLPIWDRYSSCALMSAGLTTNTALVKIGGSDFYALANGVMQKVAASTNMAALSGTVLNGTFNNFCFFVDSAGNLTSAMGTAGATLAAMTFPQFPTQKAFIGLVIINPTGTGSFIGGTTSLTDGTVVPNAVFINGNGAFDPYALIGAV